MIDFYVKLFISILLGAFLIALLAFIFIDVKLQRRVYDVVDNRYGHLKYWPFKWIRRKRLISLKQLSNTISRDYLRAMEVWVRSLINIDAYLAEHLKTITTINHHQKDLYKTSVENMEQEYGLEFSIALKLEAKMKAIAGSNLHLREYYDSTNIKKRISDTRSKFITNIQRVKEKQYCLDRQKIYYAVLNENNAKQPRDY